MINNVYLCKEEKWGNKWHYPDTLVKIAKSFNVEVYELLKPENTLSPATGKIFAKYNEEVNAIVEKSFETAKKFTSQSLTAMQKQYLSK
jgi:hypothetical protein